MLVMNVPDGPPRVEAHYGSFHIGDHVLVKGYGGATVVECPHHERYGGRIEVQYDDDGKTYHCYPSRLKPWLQSVAGPVPQMAQATADSRTLASEAHHGLHVGDHVMVKGYGEARLMKFVDEGQYCGRFQVRYDDDGTTYHCFPSKLLLSPRKEVPVAAARPPVTAPAPSEAKGVGGKASFRVGDRVAVAGYGDATVVDLPADGKYAGRVKVRYDDGTTYHCHAAELTGISAPSASDVRIVTSMSFHCGDVVMVKNYGFAKVVGLPREGKYAGRVKVSYPDGSTYHCRPHELTPRSDVGTLAASGPFKSC